mgnify:CR=1 FL=1
MRIKCENISKIINTERILKNISFEVDEGKVLILFGANGAGKTTLMKIVALLEKPTEGKIFYDGIEKNLKNTDARRKTAFVFQTPILLNRSVRENLIYGPKKRNLEYGNLKINKLSESLGIKHLLSKPSEILSGGEKKRVMIAMTLMCEPKILFLDEPFSNLDIMSTKIIEDFLMNLKRNNSVTMIMSTHDFSQAQKLGDEILILRKGVMIKKIKPDLQLSPSLSSIAVPSNNLIKVEIEEKNGNCVAVLPNGKQIYVITSVRGSAFVTISPTQIILSSQEIVSSARNVLKGRIAHFIEENGIVLVTVDVGFLVDVIITKSSFEEMELSKMKEVFLIFKASSVSVYKEVDFHENKYKLC